MSHIWMRHVTHMNEFFHTYRRTMPQSAVWLGHVTHMNESYHQYAWHVSRIQPIADTVAQNLEMISKNFQLVPGVPEFSWNLSLVSSITWYESKIRGQNSGSLIFFRNNLEILCHPICNRPYVWHDVFKCLAWCILICDKTHSYVWHDSSICVTRCIQMFGVVHSYLWQDSFICVTWLIHMCDTMYSNVWRGAFLSVTRLIHMCDMTHPYVWHDVFKCVAWCILICDMTYSYVCDMTHPYV